jgi:hypothetical protein
MVHSPSVDRVLFGVPAPLRVPMRSMSIQRRAPLVGSHCGRRIRRIFLRQSCKILRTYPPRLEMETVPAGPINPPLNPPIEGILHVTHKHPKILQYFQWVPYGTPTDTHRSTPKILKYFQWVPYGTPIVSHILSIYPQRRIL